MTRTRKREGRNERLISGGRWGPPCPNNAQLRGSLDRARPPSRGTKVPACGNSDGRWGYSQPAPKPLRHGAWFND